MIEVYKAYLADVQNIGARYSSSNAFYLTVVSALLGVLALAESNKPFEDIRVEVVVTVAIFAVIICWIWWKTINFYSLLFFAKFEVLRGVEPRLPTQPFIAETRILTTMKVEWLLKNERKVLIIVGLFFIVLMLAALLLT